MVVNDCDGKPIASLEDMAKVFLNYVDFKTRKYISKDFTVPTAELNLASNPDTIHELNAFHGCLSSIHHLLWHLQQVGTHLEISNQQNTVRALISVDKSSKRTVQASTVIFHIVGYFWILFIQVSGANIHAEFTLQPRSAQERLGIVTPIGDSNFYYNVKLYNAVPRGTVKVDDDVISLYPRPFCNYLLLA